MTESNKKGLALSGGGFRATLYALGSLSRMNEDGLLTELDTITAVSGGAIAAGYLMLKWSELDFEVVDEGKGRYRATNFHEVITKPLLHFCSGTITSKRWIALATATPRTSAVKEVHKKYETKLFGEIKLKDIPDCEMSPEFIFYGTNLDTGVSVRIGKHFLRDYNIGIAKNHDITLAQAVSITSGFPPFLSPVCLDGASWEWSDGEYQKLSTELIEKLRKHLTLCDGGLYDNMGLEMLWKHGKNKQYDTVFSCDAGAPFSVPWDSLWRSFYNWAGKFARMSDIMINQQRALRKRMLVRNYEEKEYCGAYWSIENKIAAFNGIESLISEEEFKGYEHLKYLGTQLKGFKGIDNYKLVNLGFCHTDISLRSWFDPSLTKPHELPFPSYS
ncbi:Patatin-like phospholipase family protein [Vibrio chagasii]|nr:Patatin-like phospholipase family protein [Vibrio chagasii]